MFRLPIVAIFIEVFFEGYMKQNVKLIYTLDVELNPVCHFLALLGAHHILHVFGIRVRLRLFRKSQKNIKKYK